jgi:hypothetical protein
MSWLDLPPLELPGAGTTAAPGETGLVKGLLGLVAGGLVGFWTTSTVEVWKPQNPAALATVLGVGEAEREDMGDGFAEIGHIDRRANVLHVRNRNPRSGAPRHFPVQPVGHPDLALDPRGVWHLTHIADVAIRRDERWQLQAGGYGAGELSLSLEIGQWQGQRRLIVSATPARVGRRWDVGRPVPPKAVGAEPSRTAGVPITRPGLDQAVALLVSAMAESGLSPWEFMPVFDTV